MPARPIRRPLSLALALLLAIVLPGCVSAPPEHRAALELMRFKYLANSSDSGSRWLVSAIASGDTTAPRVIFIHGTPGDAENFASFAIDPIDGAESVLIDRPGFGETIPSRAVPSLAAQADAVAPLLVKRDGVWPVLVGHSLGGPIALRVAAEHPDKVGAVVVLAGSVDPSQEQVLFIQRAGEFAFMPSLLPSALRNANRELIPLKDELEALESMLARVRCPVVIVHGDDDSLVPYANAAWLRERLTNAPEVWTTTIPGEDHFFVWTSPEEVRRAVITALDAAKASR
jgi:pimeloyl-ACP methyl ester carboxylesterase